MHKDEFYTITLEGSSEKVEKIPPRGSAEYIPPAKATQTIIHPKPIVFTEQRLENRNFAIRETQPIKQKTFSSLPQQYKDKTHEKTEHIPFKSYWPCFEYMSEAQMNWYFYLRTQLKNDEYTETDLSYIFVYIYEILNQINITDPNDGFKMLISVWKNYRTTHPSLDRYLVEWAVDYINYYYCDPKAAFELLEKEGLFLLLPTDVLFAHYLDNDMPLTIELIARFSDYKFANSEFVKSENGGLFLDNLSGLVNAVRAHMNSQIAGSFEKMDSLKPNIQKRIPFQRALFDNPNNKRLDGYPRFEQHAPLRLLITSLIKEFENQLRILLKHKGRLKYPMQLTDEILSICKACAKSSASCMQKVEITIDRDKLLALLNDSDEVRQRLLEGNFDYGPEPEAQAAPTHLKNSSVLITSANPCRDYGLSSNAKSQDSQPPKYNLLPNLSVTQQNILTFLPNNGGSSTGSDLTAAFPGVFIGVEIDGINDIALETISDLLVGFEDDLWYIMEEYINDL